MSHPNIIIALILASVLAACTDADVSKEVFRDDEAEQAAATRAGFQKLIEDYRTGLRGPGRPCQGPCLPAGLFRCKGSHSE